MNPKTLAIRAGIDALAVLVGILPLTEKQKKDYVERVEEKRDFYQPLIEDKTGVKLGNVFVLPNRLAVKQDIYEMYTQLSDLELNKALAKTKSPTEKRISNVLLPFLAIPPAMIIGSIMLYHGERTEQKVSLSTKDGCIRVPLGYRKKQMLFCEKIGSPSTLDELVVHELSHILWDKLENNNKLQKLPSLEITEGFATYCQESFFADLYPKDYQLNTVEFGSPVYDSGKKKIEELVAKYGENVLLKIPNNWQRLIKE